MCFNMCTDNDDDDCHKRGLRCYTAHYFILEILYIIIIFGN